MVWLCRFTHNDKWRALRSTPWRYPQRGCRKIIGSFLLVVSFFLSSLNYMLVGLLYPGCIFSQPPKKTLQLCIADFWPPSHGLNGFQPFHFGNGVNFDFRKLIRGEASISDSIIRHCLELKWRSSFSRDSHSSTRNTVSGSSKSWYSRQLMHPD